MTTLWQIQQRFATAIVRSEPTALDGLLAGQPAQAAARAAVYVNNHHIGLREALGALYPVVGRLVGSECFDLLARQYVTTHPKPSGNVLDFGEFFADLIAETATLAGLPYLADVARLEWLRHEVSRAADGDAERSLSLATLAALGDDALARLRLRRMPTARLYQSRFPVLRIWHSNQEAKPDPLSLDDGGVKCLVLRAGLELRLERLSDGEYAFLEALEAQTVCAAAELALQAEPRFDLAPALARWLNWLQFDAPRSNP